MPEKALLMDVSHMHGMVFRLTAPESCSFNIPDERAHLSLLPSKFTLKKLKSTLSLISREHGKYKNIIAAIS